MMVLLAVKARGQNTSGRSVGQNQAVKPRAKSSGQIKWSNLEEGAGALLVPLGRRSVERAIDLLHLVKPHRWSNRTAGQIEPLVK